MARKVCQICGESAGIYPLCKTHLQMKEQGLVVKNEETKKWELVEHKPSWIKEKKDKEKCIICNNSTEDGWKYLCKDCYFTTLDYIKELDKNMSTYQFKDYYFNLKQNIYRMTGYNNFIKPNLLKLIAIAKANDRYNNNKDLLNKVEQEVKDLVLKKKDKDFLEEEKKVIEHNEKVQKKEYRSQDGHFLDSQIEISIDDILFNSALPHAIHYPVFEITERSVYCDWYIPVTHKEGIYIELWGMDKKDYIDNKEDKKILYIKHNLKLIDFDKGELGDTLSLKRDLITKIGQYTNEILDKNKK